MKFAIVLPALLSFLITMILCPVIIPFLKRLKFGQYIRTEGPKSHQKKSGTPTMGGVIILLSVVLTSFFYVDAKKEIVPILFMTVGFGLIGFLDDYIKVVMKRNLGLRAWQKFVAQVFVTLVFLYYLYHYTTETSLVILPFTNGSMVDLGMFYIPMYLIVMLGTVNGSNLTDGLDGLLASVTVLIATFFSVVASVSALQQLRDISPITCAVAGSLLGFLIYNVYPARVFMGDTGSLALGGFVASTACILRMPLFLAIVAAIYLIEVLSVILQVVYFKITNGKRIFKMAPIHHHFELCGWAETRVVAVFSIITAILCLVGFLAM